MKNHLLTLILMLFCFSINAQTLTDGLMMPQKKLCTGFLYTHDRWENYWEGVEKRNNLNIGQVTTQSLAWMGAYGITDKLNAIAMVPYIKTDASLGTLRGMDGIQDLTLALKYNFLELKSEKLVSKTFIVGSFSTPLAKYTPDFLPLSLGLGSTNAGARLTTFIHLQKMWFFNASGGYTWRSNVTLDRVSYFDEGRLYLSNEVNMPDVLDYFVSTGYLRNGLQAEVFYAQQNTLGGSDIRKQDMPFVSNRMNFSRTGLLLMYYLPQIKGLALRGSASRVVAGRNVGQSTTFTGGILYTFNFSSSN